MIAFGVLLLELFYIDARGDNVAYVFPLLLFLFFSLSIILSNDFRPYVFFGPNILYRVLTFLFLYMILFFDFSNKKILLLIIFILFSLGMLLTRSRGALLVLASALLFASHKLLKTNNNKSNSFFILVLLFIFFNLFNSIIEPLAIQRLLLYEESFLYYRLDVLSVFYDFVSSESLANIFFGLGQINSFFDHYPHNLLIESLVYYGIPLFLLPLFFILFCFNSKEYSSINILLLISVFMGSLVSGDLMESFLIFSAGAIYLSRQLLNE